MRVVANESDFVLAIIAIGYVISFVVWLVFVWLYTTVFTKGTKGERK